MTLTTRLAKLEQAPIVVLPQTMTPLQTADDVVSLVELTVNDLRTGRIDVPTANALGALAAVALKALETADLAGQMEALRRVLEPERQRQIPQRRR
jgi:phosphoribosylcarboxyaminoimidazole (NCAIR) mutase